MSIEWWPSQILPKPYPGQAVDIFIGPKGWFTTLVWRWIHWEEMAWGDQVPLAVRKGKP